MYPGDWQVYLKGGKSLEKYVRVTEPFFEFTFLNEDKRFLRVQLGTIYFLCSSLDRVPKNQFVKWSLMGGEYEEAQSLQQG